MRRMPGWICAFPYPLVRSLPRGYLPKWPNMPALSQWLHLLRGKHKPKSLHPQDVSGRLQPAPYPGACLHCLASTADAWASYPNLRYLHGRWLRGGEDLGVASHVRLVAVPSQSATAGHLSPQGPACKEAPPAKEFVVCCMYLYGRRRCNTHNSVVSLISGPFCAAK